MTHNAIRANALHTLLDMVPPSITCLSLDCFDTLIWRNLNAPVDVFPDLGLPGGSIERRRMAEGQARALAPHLRNRSEVTLEEIHAELVPDNVEHQQALVQAELDAEARHCFAFAPVRDLIVGAKQRGMKVVVVSDTYLSEARLRTLIADVAGADLLAMIDQVFCSCEYGIGKTRGLFAHVLKETGLKPSEILHIGDNLTADVSAPAFYNINAVHLQQFSLETLQRLRMEAAAGTMLDSTTRNTHPAYQPHRAQIALRENDDPVYAFGHDVLGPVMSAFATWLHDEAEALEKETGKPVKLLFLLRDGHLPARAFTALYPQWADRVKEVSISRFTAVASSFRDSETINRYMMPWLVKNIRRPISKATFFTRQLLFSDEEGAALTEGKTMGEFGEDILKPEHQQLIVDRSRAFSRRLVAHLHGEGIDDGDTVMMIDLGYAGTVQDAVEAVLREDMGLTVAGRYLLLREQLRQSSDKKGFFDTRNYDYRAITSIYGPISVLEQFCTVGLGSVVDYAADGTPIRDEPGVKGAQSDIREQAQHACIDFVRETGKGFVRPPRSDNHDARRRGAAGILARLLYMPMDSEIAMLENFAHDVNFGTDAMIEMFDPASADRSLRRRGMFYTKNAMRMYLPGELHKHGLPMNMTLFGMRRFALDFAKDEFNVDAMQLPIQIFGGGQSSAETVGAHRTADGFYRATIPVGRGEFTVGIFLGRLFEYVQFDEISFQPVDELVLEAQTPAHAIIEGMDEVAKGLYRIEGADGFMVVQAVPAEQPMLLNLVFRPIVTRAKPKLESIEPAHEAVDEGRRAAA
ncbi:HAD family hydrolase [Sphingomonas quercus]|uniref:Haloacid dehalogenase-like hydrolase n=1 Tax=Sphingomonas quercus TaxID=2842451 RepID=A0ABS6BN47_9SPHN|nr:HAD family hydrolase [Sphingomonas quercus]MBU3078669.1 hypothetical protein [Sphingomonas quercus]